jgi:hypothetical protein
VATLARSKSRFLGGLTRSKMGMLTMLRGLTRSTTIWTLTAIRISRLRCTTRVAVMVPIISGISTSLSVTKTMLRMGTSIMSGATLRTPTPGTNRMHPFKEHQLDS